MVTADVIDNQIKKIRYFLPDELVAEDDARERLQLLAKLPDVVGLAALPDLHVKEENPFPTGTALVTKNTLYPFGVGKRIGCGMRLVKTSLNANELPSDFIDNFFVHFKSFLPDLDESRVPKIQNTELYDLLYDGQKWAAQHFDRHPDECKHTENQGSFFKGTDYEKSDIKKYVPSDAIKGGIRKFAYLGAVGNHFFELQKVDDTLNPEIAQKFGVFPGQLVFMIHCDSGAFSKRCGIYYNKKSGEKGVGQKLKHMSRKMGFHFSDFRFREYNARWNAFFNNSMLSGISASSEAAHRYAIIAYAAANYCIVNRTAITHFVEQSLRKAADEKNIETRLLYDVSHETIKKEQINGESFWIHRNGASAAWPASQFKSDSIFAQTGQPLLMPGAMGQDSYICAAQENVKSSWCSVNHGAGRKMKKARAKELFTEAGVKEKLNQRKIKLYKLFSKDLVTQGPDSYKDINSIISNVEGFGLAKPVARLTPLAVLKG